MPFYVNPEQIVTDKTNFARRGIGQGRAMVALSYDQGILLAADNPSRLLHKISEIYDRIAFAGVGRYNEYDQLRQAGVRYADLEGFRYSREDVRARALANLYGQALGQAFSHDIKPMEVEILVAEVGDAQEHDELYHVLFNGIVIDEDNFIALGGEAEAITNRLKEGWQDGLTLQAALKAATTALGGPERTMTAEELEVAVLDRTDTRRAFRRIEDEELAGLLAG